MFSLFPLLPSEIRRQIWLATVGPMTLTFASARGPPDPAEESPDYCSELDSTPAGEQGIPRPPLFANYTRYHGYIELSDGSSRLIFVVKPSSAYLACQESRAFLRFLFAAPVQPRGGLPTWLRFDTDIICVADMYLPDMADHAWFVQTQHLVVKILSDIDDYMGTYSDNEMRGKVASLDGARLGGCPDGEAQMSLLTAAAAALCINVTLRDPKNLVDASSPLQRCVSLVTSFPSERICEH